MKLCRDCKIEKPLSEFYLVRRNGAEPKPQTYCKLCQRQRSKASLDKRFTEKDDYNAYMKEHRQSPKGQVSFFKTRAKRCGLSEEEAAKALLYWLAHDGRCDTCGKTQEEFGGKKGLHIDHCHTTMKFRGLLCNQCNSILGFAYDDPRVLEAGAAYLKKFA